MEEVLRQIAELKAEIDKMKSASTIPIEVDAAIRARFFDNLQKMKIQSAKAASSENVNAVVSVNFGLQTTTTNSVLDNPDGFLAVDIEGVTYYLPYYL
jgi:glutamate mutase epsilon subunit